MNSSTASSRTAPTVGLRRPRTYEDEQSDAGERATVGGYERQPADGVSTVFSQEQPRP
jgi:hypothetical protein